MTKHKATFRRIAALISSTLITLSVISCGQSGTTGTTDTTAVSDTTAVEVKTGLMNTATKEEIAELGLDGYEFNLFLRAFDKWDNTDLVAETQNGDVFNDAVYNRMIMLEDRFGFRMKVGRSADIYGEEIGTYVLAGDDTYDLAFPMAQKAAAMATQGVFTNLNELKYFNLDSGHWNKMFCDTLDWNGRLYLAAGGISVNAYKSIRILMFNKSIHEDYRLEDPYALVREGKWTLDTFNTMASTAARDLNGDQNMSIEEDQWGLIWQDSMGGTPFYFGAGETFTKKNSNGIPEMVIGNARSVDVTEKIASILSQSQIYCATNNDNSKASFSNGRALFYAEGMHKLEQLREFDIDFGVLPMPKYDEAQENYVQYVDSWCPSPVCVPITAKSPERSGFLAQLLAETGIEYIKPAFYDKCLKGKYINDTESADMLDIIVNSFVLDNDVLYGWGIEGEMRSTLASDGVVSSIVASIKSAVSANIAYTDEAYSALD